MESVRSRVARTRSRQAADGLKRVEVVVPEQDAETIRLLAKALLVRRTAAGKPHRHMTPNAPASIGTIHSILERGGASDVYRLLAEIRRAPDGPVAEAARKAIATSEVYGYPALIRLILDGAPE